MNKDQVISNMITFIEDAEKDLQATNFAAESKSKKSEIVNSILNMYVLKNNSLNKLEQEVENEN